MLNQNCIIDVMLFIDVKLKDEFFVGFPTDNEKLKIVYSNDEIMEAVGFAVDEKYIRDDGIDGGYIISKLLPDGQRFLLSICSSQNRTEKPKIGFE